MSACRRRGHALDVGPWIRRELGLGLFEVSSRDLKGQPWRGEDREAPAIRIEPAQVEVGAPVIRFAAVEDRALDVDSCRLDAGRQDTEGNVRRVDPVVADRRDRIDGRGEPMWKGRRTERRLAAQPAIDPLRDRG